ncbi:hypothetical protein ACO0QE_001086 [Hanseniaspora vineae]
MITYKLKKSVLLRRSLIKDTQTEEGEEEPEKEEGLSKILTKNFELEDALRLTASHQARYRSHSTVQKDQTQQDLERGQYANIETFIGSTGSQEEKEQKNKAQSFNENDLEPQESNDDNDSLRGKETLEKVFTNYNTNTLDLPPDGGRNAYVSLVCVLILMFCTWGANASNGIILAFFLNSNAFSDGTPFKYAVITGLSMCLGQALSPFVTLAVRIFGFKPPMCFGVVCTFLGFILAAFSTKLWQLFCTLGLLCGVGISFTFVPATAVLPGWFLKKRSMALGVSLVGTGLGGFIFSLSCNALIERDQNQKWALIQMAIITTGLSVFAVFFIKQRNPPPRTPVTGFHDFVALLKTIFDVNIMKKYITNLISVWFTLAVLGYMLMIVSLSSYARARGLSANQASYLTVYLNVAQTVGRPIMGLSGDRFGRSNVTSTLTTVIIILIFGFWIPAHTNGQLVAFSVLMGLCIGVANVMNTVLLADSVAPKDFLTSWSYVNIFGSPLFLFSEAIVQSLTDHKNKANPYFHAQIFAGCCFVAAFCLSLLIREFKVRQLMKTRLQETLTSLEKYDTESSLASASGNDEEKDVEEKHHRNERNSNAQDSQDAESTAFSVHSNIPSEALLLERKQKYEYLLESNCKSFICRALYPIKV